MANKDGGSAVRTGRGASVMGAGVVVGSPPSSSAATSTAVLTSESSCCARDLIPANIHSQDV